MTELEGQTVMITGASRGIGGAAAHAFAAAGANVVLLSRSREAIADIAGQIGAAALAVPCDVSRFWEVEAAVQAALTTFGRLDVLINNAGVIEPIAGLAEVDADDWGKAIDINLKGAFHGIRATLPVMQAAGRGTIITVSSGAAHTPLEGWSAYCASKAAAAMLTRSAHLEAPELRIMGLSPGTVATPMQQTIRDSGINPVSRIDWSEHIPADWPARALVWMCGPDADDHLGEEISLRAPEIRARVGLS